jgi:hypothetical protein
VVRAKANGVEEMNDIRERYMISHVTNDLAMPGIVKIGMEHVNRVAAGVPHAVAHASYDAFVAATSSEHVF